MDASLRINLDLVDADDNDYSSDEEDSRYIIPISALKIILLKALSWYFVYEHLSQCSKTSKISHKTLPFMNSAVSKLSNSDPFTENISQADSVLSPIENLEQSHTTNMNPSMHRLENVLKSWNFKRLPVNGDGNCLFYAVAYSLLCRKRSDHTNQLLLKFDFRTDCSQPIKHLAKKLREAVVQEWMGENTMCYQSFLTHQQLKEEAHRFLQDGEFTGDVGDLVLPALVNVLAIPMAVFTSAENMPVLSLLPITSMVMESEPVFLAYLHEGPGHYDAVIRDDKENIEPLELTSGTTKCTCGRKATKGVSCAFTLDRYSTRCPCFKANQGCTSECRCKRCNNPNGARLLSNTISGQKRVRQRYDSQIQELKGRKTAKFMQDIGESINTQGSLSQFKYLLISAIIQYSHPDIQDWEDIKNIDPLFIANNYNAVKVLAKTLNLALPIFHRSNMEIYSALKQYQSQFEIFYKLHT